MKEIKRYKDYEVFKLLMDIDERPIEIEHIEETGAKQKLFKNHMDTIRADHKAVEETMQAYKTRSEYQAKVIIEMQKRIEELEAEKNKYKDIGIVRA